MAEALAMLGSKITVKGHIHRVTYKEPNYDIGGYAIIKVDCDEINGELPSDFKPLEDNGIFRLTFCGQTPSLSQRATYEIRGELIKHDTYGYQYKILCMTESVSFVNKDDVAKFFSYILPEVTAKNIMNTLSDPIDVLERGDVGALMRVQGVGPFRAPKIIEKYRETKFNSKAYVQLYEYGLTAVMIKKMVDSYGSPEVLVKKITEDPYSLIYEIKGIGWAKADQLAHNIGIAEDDPRRVAAFIYYILVKDGEDNGDTYMAFEDFLEQVKVEFPTVPLDNIRIYTVDLIKSGKLFYDKNTRRIGLMEYRTVEEEIAKEIYRISKAPSREIKMVDDAIFAAQQTSGLKYSAEQIKAVKECLSKNINIISGMAGCGKSSIMLPVTIAMRYNGKIVEQCALSGKAALNLTEITNRNGSTIHRLLGYDVNGGFAYNSENPLYADMVILDETSMVDESLFLSLLKAIPNGCKLIMLGDTGQLEPIGLGCLFRDLINSECINHIHFTKIFRQAQRSGIISEAARVYNGEPITTRGYVGTEIRGELQDFKVEIFKKDMVNFTAEVVREYKRFMDEYNARPQDIVIVVGKRVIGDTSARAINESIQRLVNPDPTLEIATIRKKEGETSYSITFKVGDRVLVTKNCYKTCDLKGNLTPVFNGNIGTIVEIEDGGMKIDFLQGIVCYPADNYADLELGYAITCHKVQGSGIPYVITVCDWGSYTLLSKEWLYTAITRAKKYNTLIGINNAIIYACDHTAIVFKKTWLKDLIQEVFSSDGTISNPSPKIINDKPC